ncbi:hypothetical protein IV500_05085 [Paeniglutamicibacter antarcticus]|uniref:Uncharacterized protein n=1 Tax=Arthrobacter terrae TaxID=2935737 RepID=A0A931G4H2_9MICC|nr:hypothetical protein [Arthrobacter terrae]MBG0738793.1 hypothetical protein [Arthrobacter terrae]
MDIEKNNTAQTGSGHTLAQHPVPAPGGDGPGERELSARDTIARVIVAAYGENSDECPCEQDLDVADAIIAYLTGEAAIKRTAKAILAAPADYPGEEQALEWAKYLAGAAVAALLGGEQG